MVFTPALPVADALPRQEAVPTPSSRGVLRRMFDALVDGRRRQAERHIALYVGETSLLLTDEMERVIERRFLSYPRR